MEPRGPLLLTADLGPGVVAGFTGRAGGCSTGDHAGLNLGQHVGDDPRSVAENRRRVSAAVGAPVVFARQVHGTRCAVLPAPVPDPSTGPAVHPAARPTADPAAPPHRDPDPDPDPDPYLGDLGRLTGGYDALVATVPGSAVGVLVADCVPVLLADPEAGIVAVAHAGRPGLLAGVLPAVVAAMAGAGASPGRTRAVLGPCAGPCCYEVPADLRDAAADRLPATWAVTTWGTPSMDLRAGCRAELERAGVGDVRLAGGCTIEDARLYSYRRSPVTGRFAGVVMMAG